MDYSRTGVTFHATFPEDSDGRYETFRTVVAFPLFSVAVRLPRPSSALLLYDSAEFLLSYSPVVCAERPRFDRQRSALSAIRDHKTSFLCGPSERGVKVLIRTISAHP